MRSGWLAAGMTIAVLLACGSARADDEPSVDCANATTQSDMTACAEQDYSKADDALNAQYKLTRAAMKAMDADLDDSLKGAEKALLTGQRAWLDYRNGECEAEGFQARGGSMEPMLVASCKATMTRQRTKELKQLADGQEN